MKLDNTKTLESLGHDLQEVKASLRKLDQAPGTVGEAERAVDDTIDVLAKRARELVPFEYLLSPGCQHVANELERMTSVSMPAWLAIVAPDMLRGALLEEVQSIASKLPPGLTASAREASRRALLDRQANIEWAEAELLWARHPDGMAPWRPDHDPAAVLGLPSPSAAAKDSGPLGRAR